MKEQKNREKSGYGRIIKYTGIFGGVQGLSLAAGILRTKFAAVLLGEAGIGLVSIFNSALSVVSNCTNLGLSFSAIRNLSEAHEKGDQAALEQCVRVIRTWSFLTALLGALACIALAPLLSSWTFEGSFYYTTRYMLLSPIVAFTAIIGGETAILKGTQLLTKVALYSFYATLASLLISIPLFYFFKLSGIVPALLLVSLASLLLVASFSFKAFPYRISLFSREVLGQGSGMLRLGVSFAFAGILGSGAELAIRAFLQEAGSISVTGLYSCGYTLTVTFAGLVFAAVDADFFPRLSAINHDTARSIGLVNEQIEALVLLISPLLIGFLIFLPIILPLFYSGKFLPVIVMTQFAMTAMFAKALTLPMAYMSLSKGDSVIYLIQESLYDVAVVLLVTGGYTLGGLRGTGIALAVAGLFDWLLVYLITHVRYHFTLSRRGLLISLIQFLFFAGALLVTQILKEGWLYWLAGMGCCLVSGIVSLYILQKNTTLLPQLLEKMRNRWRKKQ